jgi:sugar transferase (PEP-CTERM/EpsH1 system associated)
MRVLFITPYVPSRIRVRSFHLIRSLARSHEISLVALLCDAYEQQLVREIQQYCVSVDLISLSRWQGYANCLCALPSLLPLRVAYYQSQQLIRCIAQVIQERDIELVHGELIKVVPALQSVLDQRRIPVIYDAVDCISSYLQQSWLATRNPLQKAFLYAELLKMCSYEPRALRGFEHVTITSAFDKERLVKLGVAPQQIHVLPNGVDTTYFALPREPRQEDTLVFCAKLDYAPNAQAILQFCQAVLPRIWRRRPQVRLTIVGNNPPPAVRALESDERIVVTGYVEDIRPYLGSATVALAPLLVAAGMQNKVLEALSMATPLVATPAACRSLQVKDDVHLLIAQEADAYADAVLHLLENPWLAQRLGQAGRAYVERHHSWMSTAMQLNELYGQMAALQPALAL